jgi:C_GCAxxG_C_C family probable redox protein
MMHGDTCGAFTGAIMAVGLKYGHWDVNTLLRQKEEMMNKYAEFRTLFLEKFATNSCKELLGYDVSLPEQFEEALSSGRMLDFCPKVVESVIEMLEEIL